MRVRVWVRVRVRVWVWVWVRARVGVRVAAAELSLHEPRPRTPTCAHLRLASVAHVRHWYWCGCRDVLRAMLDGGRLPCSQLARSRSTHKTRITQCPHHTTPASHKHNIHITQHTAARIRVRDGGAWAARSPTHLPRTLSCWRAARRMPNAMGSSKLLKLTSMEANAGHAWASLTSAPGLGLRLGLGVRFGWGWGEGEGEGNAGHTGGEGRGGDGQGMGRVETARLGGGSEA